MRETKEQKITRLERQKKELEDLVKQLKKTCRGTGKDSQEEIKKLKSEIRQLKSKHKSEIELLMSEKEELRGKIDELNETIEFLKFRLKSKETHDGSKEEDDEWLKTLDEDRRRRLESFNFGLDSDRYGREFFSLKDFLITINPKTGEWLSDFERQGLLEYVRNNNKYKRFLREHTETENEFLVLDECRKLYEELYKNYQF